MIQMQGAACTMVEGWAWRWTEEGYVVPVRPGHYEGVLTPPSTVRALHSGYDPELHPMIAAARTMR